jgi:hypothetical protein
LRACQVFRQKRIHMENQDRKTFSSGMMGTQESEMIQYKSIWADIRCDESSQPLQISRGLFLARARALSLSLSWLCYVYAHVRMGAVHGACVNVSCCQPERMESRWVFLGHTNVCCFCVCNTPTVYRNSRTPAACEGVSIDALASRFPPVRTEESADIATGEHSAEHNCVLADGLGFRV